LGRCLVPDVFLSYSREDQPTARLFAEGLKREGFDVWWDQALHPGEAFDQVTEKALEEAGAVIVLWSRKSVESRWVRAEALQALNSNRLVPVMIEPCKRPIMFELTHTADLAHWQGEADDPQWRSFVASVGRQLGRTPLDSPAQQSPHRPVPASPVRPPRPSFRIAVILLASALLLAAGWWGMKKLEGSTIRATDVAQSPSSFALAVLPFRNLPEDPAQEHLSDGLTEDVTTQLDQISALTVLDPQSSARFKDSTLDPRDIARELGADYLVQATLQREADKLEVTVRLLRRADGSIHWSRSYRTDLAAVSRLDFQRQLAQEIAEQVGVVLEIGDLPPARGGTRVVDAYLKYKAAIALANQSESNAAKSVDLLREAVRLDPQFDIARLSLYLYLSPAKLYSPGEAPALRDEQEREAQQLEKASRDWQLDSGFLAARLRSQHRWQEALDAAPSSSNPTHMANRLMTLIETGRFQDALGGLRAQVRKDPLAWLPSVLLQDLLVLQGQPDESAREATRMRNALAAITAPGSATEDLLRQQQRMQGQARMAQLLREGSPADPASVRALSQYFLEDSLARSGYAELLGADPVALLSDAQVLRRALHASFDKPRNQVEGQLSIIAALADYAGDEDLAIAALRMDKLNQRNGWPFTVWSFPRLRKAPGFVQLLEDMKLVDYWRASKDWGDFCREGATAAIQCFETPQPQLR